MRIPANKSMSKSLSIQLLLCAAALLLYVASANPHGHAIEYFMGMLIGASIGIGVGKLDETGTYGRQVVPCKTCGEPIKRSGPNPITTGFTRAVTLDAIGASRATQPHMQNRRCAMNNQPESGPAKLCKHCGEPLEQYDSPMEEPNGGYTSYYHVGGELFCEPGNPESTEADWEESSPVKAGEGAALQSVLQVVHDSIEESRADGDIVTIHRRYLEILLASLPALTPEPPTEQSVTQNMRGRAVTHEEAKASAHRLINSHFHNPDRARCSIPVRPEDDDILLCDYISEQSAKSVLPLTPPKTTEERDRHPDHLKIRRHAIHAAARAAAECGRNTCYRQALYDEVIALLPPGERSTCGTELAAIPADIPEASPVKAGKKGTTEIFAYVPMGGRFYTGPKGTVVFVKINEDQASPVNDATYKAAFALGQIVWLAALAASAPPTQRENDKPPMHWKENDGWPRHPQTAQEWDWTQDQAGEGRRRTEQRLNFACDLADPHAPDQMVLVLRIDLMRVLCAEAYRRVEPVPPTPPEGTREKGTR